MLKTKLIVTDILADESFEDILNNFIKDKDVVDIKYQVVVIPGSIINITYDRALVIYKED